MRVHKLIHAQLNHHSHINIHQLNAINKHKKIKLHQSHNSLFWPAITTHHTINFSYFDPFLQHLASSHAKLTISELIILSSNFAQEP
jgi:hypothetical protein